MVFAASVAVYFFAARKNMQKEEAVYSSMDAPEFPVVYTEFDGKEINALHGKEIAKAEEIRKDYFNSKR